MPTLRVSGLEDRPLLDIGSFARRCSGRRDRLSSQQLALIGRTVRSTPEVMVKVLTKDSNNLRSVARHLDYIGRRGVLELETDGGTRVHGRDAGQRLVEDWDLDLDQDRRDTRLASGTGRAPKLVHKIILSMPPGTPAKGVLEAARNFTREEFALKHRYAFVLHTDEPHPHVHLVVKAVSEQGERLNIRKATLRWWRQEFARHLRELGVPANATERAVRGESRSSNFDGIYRAQRRDESWHVQARMEEVSRDILSGKLRVEHGKETLIDTRKAVERGWWAAGEILAAHGQRELAKEVTQFVSRMPPPRTDREMIAEGILKHRRDARTRDGPTR